MYALIIPENTGVYTHTTTLIGGNNNPNALRAPPTTRHPNASNPSIGKPSYGPTIQPLSLSDQE